MRRRRAEQRGRRVDVRAQKRCRWHHAAYAAADDMQSVQIESVSASDGDLDMVEAMGEQARFGNL